MRITTAIALGLLLSAGRCSLTSAANPVPGPTAGPATSLQDPYAGNFGFSDGAPYAADAPYPTGCSACGCSHCGHPSCLSGYALHRGLPNPHKSTCDMPQHYMYIAEPKFYYYFRPYNWFHIPVQQDDVRAFGGDPRHPYDNRIFQSVYEQLQFDEPAPETINPPGIPAVPMSRAKPGHESRAAVETRSTEKLVPVSTSERAAESRSQVRIRRVSLND